ncbi:hypothetical protein [Flavobacterium sp. ABG]|jgi:hypothetical protein|uniref:hypothetical protein n=1 Tax=Flavobacterium sp. ABG TaxID=1423322 RepID=UPI00064A9400|nr:hypothetical protein [Flavobacterium sp. ABG]KLT69895.1 hypothetical protein AB674_09315 [Flavobacterium sp. ABG]
MRYTILVFLFFFFSPANSQDLGVTEKDLIRKNILSYRIFYLTKEIDSEYQFSRACLLPLEDWNLKISTEVEPINFPNNKKYTFYRITNFDYTYFKFDSDDTILKKNSNCGFVPFSNRFLVAVNKDKILFISGMFFKDPIASFFKLNIKDPESFIEYLNMKLFNFSINNITFKKIKKNKLIYTGFISTPKDIVTIEIDLKNFDNVNWFYTTPPKETIYLK